MKKGSANNHALMAELQRPVSWQRILAEQLSQQTVPPLAHLFFMKLIHDTRGCHDPEQK